MDLIALPSFSAVALGTRATTMVPVLTGSLGKVTLNFGGGLVKSNLTQIVGKIGSRTFFGPVTGAQLDQVMKYRGQFDKAAALTLDLTERNANSYGEKNVGAIDLPGLGGEAVFIEVLNSLGAGTPTLSGIMGMLPRQFTDRDKDGRITEKEQGRQAQLIHKLIPFQLPNTGTRNIWQPNFRGAAVKRLHIIYTGTDWTATADGNVHTVEVRLNGRPVHDRISCLANRFHQQENGLVPQSRTYTVDFCADHDFGRPLQTRGARSLEVLIDMTTAESPIVLAEVLDLPDNL